MPIRHEMPVTGELANQNIKDRFHGSNDPVAKKMMARFSGGDHGGAFLLISLRNVPIFLCLLVSEFRPPARICPLTSLCWCWLASGASRYISVPPADVSITTLWVGGLDDAVSEADLRCLPIGCLSDGMVYFQSYSCTVSWHRLCFFSQRRILPIRRDQFDSRRIFQAVRVCLVYQPQGCRRRVFWSEGRAVYSWAEAPCRLGQICRLFEFVFNLLFSSIYFFAPSHFGLIDEVVTVEFVHHLSMIVSVHR